MPSWMNNNLSSERVRLRRQLMILLYVESMLYILSKRLGNLVKHSDSLVQSGKLGKRRLILPGIKRLRKWLSSTLQEEDIDREHFSDSFVVSLGQAYSKRKDPEHLPPQTAWERSTNIFRRLGHFFGSSASGFGLRAAVATMSIAIVNYVSPTQVFFTKQRLFWVRTLAHESFLTQQVASPTLLTQ